VHVEFTKPVCEVPTLLFHSFPKYVLLILCLIIFCACPAFAAPTQSRSLEGAPYLALLPDIVEEYRANFENTFAATGQGFPDIGSLREYISGKRQFFSERNFENGTWSIAPLLDNRTNSRLFVDVPIGVILKIRF
jgi:hypothetical protein